MLQFIPETAYQMISLFRKIRYDLMEKNQTPAGEAAGSQTGNTALLAGRYLKYAIGEIILVVIGILIAIKSITN